MTNGIGFLGRGVLVAACASLAHGDVLFGVRGDRLYRIDTDAVTAEEVGSIGLGSVAGLAFGANGELYGLTAGTSLLIGIDPETASGEVLAALNVPVSTHSGLASDPTTNLLYAISSQGAGTASFLVVLSPETMVATPVADTTASVLLGLGCDAGGQLFGLDGAAGVDEMVLIDKTSGALTPFPFDLTAFKATGSLEVGPTGRVWTVNSVGSSYELVEIDPTDGFPSSLGFLQGVQGSGAMNGLAAQPAKGLTVFPPSPGTVGALNTVIVTGAEPGQKITLVYGLYPGSSNLRKCGAVVEIAAPFALKTKKADQGGVASFKVPIRKGIEGQTILLQAVAFGSCEASQVLSVDF